MLKSQIQQKKDNIMHFNLFLHLFCKQNSNKDDEVELIENSKIDRIFKVHQNDRDV